MADKYFYDKNGNYIGRSSDEGPSSGGGSTNLYKLSHKFVNRFFVIGTIVGALIGGIFCCIIGNDAEVCFPMGAGGGAVVGFFGSGFLMEIIGACKK